MSKRRKKRPFNLPEEEKEQIINELLRTFKSEIKDEEIVEELYDEKEDPLSSLSSQDLKKLKIELKELLLKDHKKILDKLKKLIRTESEKFDEIVLLLLRYKELQAAKTKGIISFTESGNELRNINNSILLLINTLEIEHLK